MKYIYIYEKEALVSSFVCFYLLIVIFRGSSSSFFIRNRRRHG